MKVVDAAKVFNWLSDCVFAIAPWNNERNKNADYSAIDVANKQIEVLREVMQYIEESEFDAVPIVKCKDCKYFSHINLKHGCINYCDKLSASTGTDEFFCGWAEKREE